MKDLEARLFKTLEKIRVRADNIETCDNGFRGICAIMGGSKQERKLGRVALQNLADAGKIERKEFGNGIFWRAKPFHHHAKPKGHYQYFVLDFPVD